MCRTCGTFAVRKKYEKSTFELTTLLPRFFTNVSNSQNRNNWEDSTAVVRSSGTAEV